MYFFCLQTYIASVAFGYFKSRSGTTEPFGCADKPAEKHCWLICCERKILFRLKKNKPQKTDYKPNEQGLHLCHRFFVASLSSRYLLLLLAPVGHPLPLPLFWMLA
jgi:hypothetical protein